MLLGTFSLTFVVMKKPFSHWCWRAGSLSVGQLSVLSIVVWRVKFGQSYLRFKGRLSGARITALSFRCLSTKSQTEFRSENCLVHFKKGDFVRFHSCQAICKTHHHIFQNSPLAL